MNAFFTGLQREWQRVLTQPSYWATLFLLPLLSFILVSGVIATHAVNDVTLDLVDQDQSQASRDLRFRLDASASVAVQKQLPSVHDALQRAKDKDSFGYLVIPEGYQRSLIAGQPVTVDVFVNQQNFMLGNTLTSHVLRQIIESSVRDSTAALMAGGQMKEQALANIQPVQGARSVLGNSRLNYRTFLLATLLPHLWHVVVMVVTVMAIGTEFKDGTPKAWLAANNHSLALALTTKLLVPGLVMGLWLAGITVFIFADNQAGGHASLFSLLIAGWLTQFCYQTAGLLTIAVLANYRRALSVAAFYTTPAFAFIGITFPTFNMNWISQTWLALLPIGIFVQVQNRILHWQQGLVDVLPDLAVIAVFALCFGSAGMLRLRGHLLRPELWHQH
ncbi:ABC transporter permease [Reinekea blandensis]|uniref:ABC-2 type transporter transmembrane domain-containing protein n=1 Tax=Reinekea blandensis MED297 TaxID=314283 RepID=A4BF82_9GAMM|nr:ABC transporter permease [Reinekea blandensis]EAR09195.1 hypothetical protein MED297_06928 [Reinekea sp. MED297] [Reinekea blandensis MED297]